MLRLLGNSIRNNMTAEEFFEKWWTPKELPKNGFNKTAMLDFAEMYHKEQVKKIDKPLVKADVIKSFCPVCGDELMQQVNSTNLNCVRCGETVKQTVL